MKIYCFSCGAANAYTYSSGKPENCATCHSSFEQEVSTTNTSVASTPAKKDSAFQWVKAVNFNDIFTITVED